MKSSRDAYDSGKVATERVSNPYVFGKNGGGVYNDSENKFSIRGGEFLGDRRKHAVVGHAPIFPCATKASKGYSIANLYFLEQTLRENISRNLKSGRLNLQDLHRSFSRAAPSAVRSVLQCFAGREVSEMEASAFAVRYERQPPAPPGRPALDAGKLIAHLLQSPTAVKGTEPNGKVKPIETTHSRYHETNASDSIGRVSPASSSEAEAARQRSAADSSRKKNTKPALSNHDFTLMGTNLSHQNKEKRRAVLRPSSAPAGGRCASYRQGYRHHLNGDTAASFGATDKSSAEKKKASVIDPKSLKVLEQRITQKLIRNCCDHKGFNFRMACKCFHPAAEPLAVKLSSKELGMILKLRFGMEVSWPLMDEIYQKYDPRNTGKIAVKDLLAGLLPKKYYWQVIQQQPPLNGHTASSTIRSSSSCRRTSDGLQDLSDEVKPQKPRSAWSNSTTSIKKKKIQQHQKSHHRQATSTKQLWEAEEQQQITVAGMLPSTGSSGVLDERRRPQQMTITKPKHEGCYQESRQKRWAQREPTFEETKKPFWQEPKQPEYTSMFRQRR